MKRLTESFLILILLLCSCGDKKPQYPFADLSLEKFADMQKDKYKLSEKKIRFFIDSFRLATRDTDYVDILCNTYYAEREPFLWINRGGSDIKSDIVLNWLDSAKASGIPAKRLFIDKIEKALHRTRTGRYDEKNTANRTLATLEYYLTKGYMRYAKGQRYGFVDAKKVFNHLDIDDSDPRKKDYRVLYSANYENFSKDFFQRAIGNITQSRIDTFLTNIQPQSDFYNRFCQALQQKPASKERNALICNIERTRWRTPAMSNKSGCVEVNIPSGSLTATNGKGEELGMKICFGAVKTKTPILNSKITHIDVNPYWIVPTSIVKKEIARHAGDSNYFARKHFEIIERSSGDAISPEEVTEEQLQHGGYTIRQKRGRYNSLGRLIFRFANEHSIYLHDTNEKGAFGRDRRSISHGCIRVEKPLELAKLYIDNSDKNLMQNLNYSITTDPNPSEEEGNSPKTKDGHFINQIDLKPDIPIYIYYYTAYPNRKDNSINYYSDIYNYDAVLLKHLKHE